MTAPCSFDPTLLTTTLDASPVLLAGAAIALVILLVLGTAARYRKVDQGYALIVNKSRVVEVFFTGALVLPGVHRAEVMDISVKTIEVERAGERGLVCKDDIRADIKATFFVRVNPTAEDVLAVAQAIGTGRASHPQTLERLFRAKFSEALETVGKRLDFEDLYVLRHDFKQQIVEVIGRELNGYVLDDAVIDYLEQTPVTQLDPRNVLDARGIQKITAITAEEAIATNALRREKQRRLRKTDVAAREAVLELGRQQACAEARQAREVASVQARAQGDTTRVWAQERIRAELARVEQEREVVLGEGKKRRQAALAQKNRERAVAIEQWRAIGARQLAHIEREREVELQRIAERKAIEHELQATAVLVRERVAVDRTVAEQQEGIEDLRVLVVARRAKEARLIHAEAQAGAALIEDVKRAEARAQAAEHLGRAAITRAEAMLAASEKQAQARILRAEGTQAERAAPGLARVEVRRAEAAAIEAQGDARARVTVAQMKAEAAGRELQGLAEVRVEQARAQAIAARGHAEAEARRARLLAEARGTEQQGLARAAIKDADATATEAMGRARAAELREALLAEAQGLARTAEALGKLDPQSRALEKCHFLWGTMAEVQQRWLQAYRNKARERAAGDSHAG
ncbi:MAG: hypothetical protein KDK70_16615 [Myxococcales bacterium]|nr:hypothetical protein [Myxococcales bacterium]